MGKVYVQQRNVIRADDEEYRAPTHRGQSVKAHKRLFENTYYALTSQQSYVENFFIDTNDTRHRNTTQVSKITHIFYHIPTQQSLKINEVISSSRVHPKVLLPKISTQAQYAHFRITQYILLHRSHTGNQGRITAPGVTLSASEGRITRPRTFLTFVGITGLLFFQVGLFPYGNLRVTLGEEICSVNIDELMFKDVKFCCKVKLHLFWIFFCAYITLNITGRI